jgi:hypothetical protein
MARQAAAKETVRELRQAVDRVIAVLDGKAPPAPEAAKPPSETAAAARPARKGRGDQLSLES